MQIYSVVLKNKEFIHVVITIDFKTWTVWRRSPISFRFISFIYIKEQLELTKSLLLTPLFNIVEALIKNLLNFDVCVV